MDVAKPFPPLPKDVKTPWKFLLVVARTTPFSCTRVHASHVIFPMKQPLRYVPR